MGLAACNPNFEKDSSSEISSVVSSSVDSSEDISSSSGSTSESGSNSTSTSEGSSESSSESSSGSSSESSSQSSSEEPTHEHEYSPTPIFVENIDYMTYRKGYNEYHCTHSGCSEKKVVEVKYTKAEMLELMNAFIATQNPFDPFEIKQLLIDNNYPIVDNLSTTPYFVYDLGTNKVALNTTSTNYVSFREKSVANATELQNEIINVGADASSYASIKLANDIDLSETISINSANPVEINLNGHKVNNLMDNKPAFKVTKANEKPRVTIVNGTIETKSISGFDLTKSPSCISMIDAEKVRITNMVLNNRAERGYAYIDFLNKATNAEVKINNSTINSTIVAVCIQTNTNYILNNNITGVVVVNGGVSTFTGNTVDASNVQSGLEQEATRLITSQELYGYCQEVYVTENRDSYMLTATDAILIYDRRSIHSSYANPEVTITNNTLKCKVGTGNVPYGYGVRYMDLNFDPSLTENSQQQGLIVVEDNTYPYEDTQSTTHAGAYNIWSAA